MFNNIPAELLWFILGFVFLMGELTIPAFIIIFFGVGAWAASLTTLLGFTPTFALQVTVFLCVAMLTLILFRKKSRSRGHVTTKSQESHSTDSLIGKTAVVVEDIEPLSSPGKVEVFGTAWAATAEVAIQKGAAVEIVSRDNLTLKVKVKGA